MLFLIAKAFSLELSPGVAFANEAQYCESDKSRRHAQRGNSATCNTSTAQNPRTIVTIGFIALMYANADANAGRLGRSQAAELPLHLTGCMGDDHRGVDHHFQNMTLQKKPQELRCSRQNNRSFNGTPPDRRVHVSHTLAAGRTCPRALLVGTPLQADLAERVRCRGNEVVWSCAMLVACVR